MTLFKTIFAEDWEATFCPEYGGHLVRLRHIESNREVLNFPRSDEEYFTQPERFGIPVLFPPNRVAGGSFVWEKFYYKLPINEPERQNHIHGIVMNKPWDMEVLTKKNRTSRTVNLRFSHGPQHPTFPGYPHRFTLTLSYDFLPNEVVQSVLIENLDEPSASSMPFGLGFHTAFRIPESSVSQTNLKVTAKNRRFELDPERRIPTGRTIVWQPGHRYYKSGGSTYKVEPTISCHCRTTHIRKGNQTFRGAYLDFKDEETRLLYEVAEDFGYWFLWTPPDDSSVICIEPMTCLVNAPNNRSLSAHNGWRSLAPGRQWKAWTRISLSSRSTSNHVSTDSMR